MSRKSRRENWKRLKRLEMSPTSLQMTVTNLTSYTVVIDRGVEIHAGHEVIVTEETPQIQAGVAKGWLKAELKTE